METVVIVAIGVLATIFLASFVALLVVCRHRYCHPHDLLHHFDSPTVDLIGAMETQSEPSELELDDVVITNPHIEAILENEDWIEDAGLVSHCISILKVQICHTLTEKLVAMTMGSGAKVKAPASLSDIITVAKRISPVDDVVRSMYPPLDPILLDAATALLLSVSHLVLVTRNACHMSGSMDWIDQSLHAAEDHMVVLREAALASEPERGIPGADAQREQAI
uniref:Transmembrane protein 98 n=1 Tax=Mola mola TaxID=94237 RepID=A0A3Q3XKU4_MOLML